MKKPVFKKILQVAVIVRDMDESMKRYWEGFGIGPWEVYTFDSTNTDHNYAVRTAIAKIDDVEWELIQPLDDKSDAGKFLKEHGEGLHHIGFQVDDFDEALAYCRQRGVESLMETKVTGDWEGSKVVYLDTRPHLACISEIWTTPEHVGQAPQPEWIYPDPKKEK
jgi:methylmalonyl-CoA epimerase